MAPVSIPNDPKFGPLAPHLLQNGSDSPEKGVLQNGTQNGSLADHSGSRQNGSDVLQNGTHGKQNGAPGKPQETEEDSEARESILRGLRRRSNKEVPFRFLYDRRGSQLYEEITKLAEYYPFKAEEEMLTRHAHEVAAFVPEGSVVVELGCGSARKTSHLLKALVARHGRCRFAGVDVSESFLDEARCNLMVLVQGHLGVDLVAADYVEGLARIRENYPEDPLCIVWLGSGIGNLSEEEAVTFLRNGLEAVGGRCRLFLCTDMWKERETLYEAYHDKRGVTEAFIRNGMRNALGVLGYRASSKEEAGWSYEVLINKDLKQVEMYLHFPEGLALPQHDIRIRPGERVLMEISRKFTRNSIHRMTEQAGFHALSAWHTPAYGFQILADGSEGLTQCWRDTDTLFEGIRDWSSKPIYVRHPFCFYYGHLIAFMKLKLFPNDQAEELDESFSRGIDPVVLDPTKCHSHPKLPPEWPTRGAMADYVKAGREKILQANARGRFAGQGRLLALAMEHERMHQETLAYMVAQERKHAFEGAAAADLELPRSFRGLAEPPSAASIAASAAKSRMVTIEAGPVTLGVAPDEAGFVWDNESPELQTQTSATFWVRPRPVSVGEFYRFIREGGYQNPELWDPEDFSHFREKGYRLPATWSVVGGEVFVHGHQATSHWSEVGEEPVFVSLSEAMAFCRWLGCRVFTEEEYGRVLRVDAAGELVQQMRSGGFEWTSSRFRGFPGFQPMAEYPEYSADFFDGRHFVLKGSSPVTHPSMVRDSFRNFYQRQYRFAFAKFRCCR